MKHLAIFFAVFVAVRCTICPDPDPQSPTIRCPADILITTNHKAAKVHWKWPVAKDNSGLPPTINCSNSVNHTIVANPGVLTVNCSATDEAGNIATCSFKITVEGNNNCHSYPNPTNGVLVCTDYPEPYLKKVCMVACNDEYDFDREPGLLYICLRNNHYFVWPDVRNFSTNITLPWPDCTVKSSPVQKVFAHPEYYYNGDPASPCVKRRIKVNFIKVFKNNPYSLSFLVPPSKLNISQIQVYPGNTGITYQ